LLYLDLRTFVTLHSYSHRYVYAWLIGPKIDQLELRETGRMRTGGLAIFDAFNTLVKSRPGSEQTFLAGLVQTGISASTAMLADLQAASEGLDHSRWSGSRAAYCGWAAETLTALAQVGAGLCSDLGRASGTALVGQLAPRVVPALEQWHQAPMAAMPGAADCLARLKRAGLAIALCSNWGWDLAADLAGTGLAGYIDVFVTSAQAGYRKPHARIYQATLELAGFRAEDAVFVGDSLRTDALGPQRVGIRSVLLTRAEEQVHGEQVTSLGEAARLILRGLAPLQVPPRKPDDASDEDRASGMV
jgi:HAD superfamily hydrolase (TIGR01509 family)